MKRTIPWLYATCLFLLLFVASAGGLEWLLVFFSPSRLVFSLLLLSLTKKSSNRLTAIFSPYVEHTNIYLLIYTTATTPLGLLNNSTNSSLVVFSLTGSSALAAISYKISLTYHTLPHLWFFGLYRRSYGLWRSHDGRRNPFEANAML